MKMFLSLFVVLLSTTVHAEPSFEVVSVIDSMIAVAQEAKYDCTITNLWTIQRHPNGHFPANALLSTPVFFAHSSIIHVWSEGSYATNGFKKYAEVSDFYSTAALSGQDLYAQFLSI